VINQFVTSGLVFNSKGEILLVDHKKLKQWIGPGGHIDEGELPTDSVLREIHEETGIRVSLISNKKGIVDTELDLPFTIKLDFIDSDRPHNHINLVFLCKAVNDDLKPQLDEINDARWFTLEEALKLDMPGNVRSLIPQAFEYINTHPEILK